MPDIEINLPQLLLGKNEQQNIEAIAAQFVSPDVVFDGEPQSFDGLLKMFEERHKKRIKNLDAQTNRVVNSMKLEVLASVSCISTLFGAAAGVMDLVIAPNEEFLIVDGSVTAGFALLAFGAHSLAKYIRRR